MDKILEDKIIEEMKKVFKNNKRHIRHTLKVLNYAKKILKSENGNSEIVIPAAILHDIGLVKSMQKYNSLAGKYQEMEGPQIAKMILSKLNIDNSIISKVSDIIGAHHSLGKIKTDEFYIIWDADWLVNLKNEFDAKDKNNLLKIINKIFQTAPGKKIAKNIYLSN